MTIGELCHAALTRSDNTAEPSARKDRRPAGVTGFSRSIGDTVTRLDRNETSLNESLPGDPRDTTSPAASAQPCFERSASWCGNLFLREQRAACMQIRHRPSADLTPHHKLMR
jgi:hypothetical protein